MLASRPEDNAAALKGSARACARIRTLREPLPEDDRSATPPSYAPSRLTCRHVLSLTHSKHQLGEPPSLSSGSTNVVLNHPHEPQDMEMQVYGRARLELGQAVPPRRGYQVRQSPTRHRTSCLHPSIQATIAAPCGAYHGRCHCGGRPMPAWAKSQTACIGCAVFMAHPLLLLCPWATLTEVAACSDMHPKGHAVSSDLT